MSTTMESQSTRGGKKAKKPVKKVTTERQRKLKFSVDELRLLATEGHKHDAKLRSRNLTPTGRNRIWESVAEKISAVNQCLRTPQECQRRWLDLKRRTKEKISFNNRQANETGGGVPYEDPLDDIEEEVQETLQKESVHGLDGIDTAVSQDIKDCLTSGPSCSGATANTASLTPSTPEPATPPPVPNISLADIDRLLYVEQQKQATSSQQVASELAGLRINISSWRSQMQANHNELITVLDRIAIALEAKPEPTPSPVVSKPRWQLRGRRGK